MRFSVAATPWQQRIGGQWAVSWQAYGIGVALNGPLLVLTGGSIGAEPVQPEDMPGWALVAIVASAITAVWVVIGDRVLFPHRAQRPVPVAAVVAFHAMTGLLFSLAIWFVGPWVGVRSEGTFVELVIPTVAIGLWFGLTMVLLLDARDRFARRREDLLDEAVQSELVLLQQGEAAERVQTLIRERVGSVTEDLRTEVGATLVALVPGESEEASAAQWSKLADRVRASAESSLRPLSHELWRAASTQFPPPTWRDVLRLWAGTGSFSAASSAAIVFIGYMRGAIHGAGVLPGMAATALLALMIAALLRAAAALILRSPRLRPLTVALAFVIAQALGLGFTLATAPSLSLPEALGSFLGMAISVLAPSLVATLNEARGDALERLRSSTDAIQARERAQALELARVTQIAARIIHGTLQTKLVAAAAAIDQAVAADDTALLRRALAHVTWVLEGSVEGESAPRTVAEEVHRASDAWSGILHVDIFIDAGAAAMTGEAAHAVGLIVEEALANAYRHGEAEAAVVTVEESTHDASRGGLPPDGSGGGLVVTVEDDGTAETQGPGGLGTALIAGLTRGQVAFVRLPTGYRVQAYVATN